MLKTNHPNVDNSAEVQKCEFCKPNNERTLIVIIRENKLGLSHAKLRLKWANLLRLLLSIFRRYLSQLFKALLNKT